MNNRLIKWTNQSKTLEISYDEIEIKDDDPNLNKIVDLLQNHNKINTYRKFEEVEEVIRIAIRRGELEQIKILISEEVQFNNMIFKINREDKTASLFKVTKAVYELNVPRSINYEESEYIITSIIGTDSIKKIKSLHFDEESEVHTFYNQSFMHSPIENLYIPKNLKELKEGWCAYLIKLKKIEISPLNKNFIYKDDKYLLGKTDPNSDIFDVLLFARRDINIAHIPSNIKVIASYSFFGCSNMTTVDIQKDSELQSIENYAFSHTYINEIYIPQHVSNIGEYAFYICKNLKTVDISENSELKTIGKISFFLSKIDKICIPQHVEKIGMYAFSDCVYLQTVEISENSELKSIGKNAFNGTNIKKISIPSKLRKIGKGCFNSKSLTKIEISPSNSNFIFSENKYLLGKTDLNSDVFDVLLFARHDLIYTTIPSNIKIISSYAFKKGDLKVIKFQPDSELQSFGEYAFTLSKIEKISIPSNVTKICENAFYNCKELRIVEIPENSELKSIGPNAFDRTSIEKIYIPSKLNKLSYGCFNSKSLNKFEISPSNSNFIFNEDRCLLSKTDSNSDVFDVLLFASRDIKYIQIPSNIKIISSYAFTECKKLKKVEFQKDSELRLIEKFAFANTNIDRVFIPSHVSKIGEDAFYDCCKLKSVEFAQDSELNLIENFAFSYSKITSFYVPPKVQRIFEFTFSECDNLKIIEISEKSELFSIGRFIFGHMYDILVLIPSDLKVIVNS